MKKYILLQTRGGEERGIFEFEGKIEPYAVVESEWGREIGRVLGLVKHPDKKEVKGKIIRFLSGKEKELETYLLNAKIKEKKSFKVFSDLVKKYKLDKEGMKPIKAYITFDQKRLIFYYTAPQRIDFRELLRELISLFPQVIRLQQITPRQSALIKGGIGICGQELCCQRFLSNLVKITPDMVKEQLSAVASREKSKGVCGRLRCCLLYEQGVYKEEAKKLPKIGTAVKIGDKEGEVISGNILTREVVVRFKDGGTAVVKADQVVPKKN
ncbi:stage 0 sporulation protein [bacterium]|nr:stage 0 sporulation protein [bacterium]